ncbi:hypothetical protein R84B8_00077 [Treponema sp. R8-4-B8]
MKHLSAKTANTPSLRSVGLAATIPDDNIVPSDNLHTAADKKASVKNCQKMKH